MLYIGKDMQNRMVLLGLSVDEVADKAFMEKILLMQLYRTKSH